MPNRTTGHPVRNDMSKKSGAAMLAAGAALVAIISGGVVAGMSFCAGNLPSGGDTPTVTEPAAKKSDSDTEAKVTDKAADADKADKDAKSDEDKADKDKTGKDKKTDKGDKTSKGEADKDDKAAGPGYGDGAPVPGTSTDDSAGDVAADGQGDGAGAGVASPGVATETGTGDEGTYGPEVGGDPTGSYPTGGDATGGDQTGSYPTGGDATGDDPTGGDPTGGDPTGGDPTGGDPTSEDPSDSYHWVSGTACAACVADSGTDTASGIDFNDDYPQVGLEMTDSAYAHLGGYVEIRYGDKVVKAQIVDVGSYKSGPSGIMINPGVFGQFGVASVSDWGSRTVKYRFL